MSHYFLVSAVFFLFFFLFFLGGEVGCLYVFVCLFVFVSGGFFYGNSRTSHGRSYDWLVANGPSLHPTDKHSYGCLFLACLTQLWPLSGTGPRCRIG